MSEPLVYLNGHVLPASQASMPIYDAGVVMGATVTEMARTFNGEPFRIDDHLDRLFRSLRYLRFTIDETKEKLAVISRELVSHNLLFLPAGGELAVNQFVTAGAVAGRVTNSSVRTQHRPGYSLAGAEGDKTPPHSPCTVCVNTFPLVWQLWAKKVREGAHLITPSIRQLPPQCLDPTIKHRSRMHNYLADQEARLVDSDASALLLDLDGNVTETSAANFLSVKDGTIFSPPLRNILPGVSRATVIELAAQLGIAFVERDCQLDHVLNADEAFLSSTLYCLMPVTKINGATIGGGQPGPIFRRLLTAWSKLVGVDIEQQILKGATS
jgi:branched-chain amino acid aminotransferase